jgi:urate oxidase
LNVTSLLSGDMEAVHYEGDNANILPTDTQKNTVYAFARVVDLAPFGQENENVVFHADDRPYGLIQATITRDDAPAAGVAFD